MRSFRLVWLLLHWGENRTDSSDIEGIGREEYSGEILTTNYLNFSQPKALAKLNELKNITLKMYDVDAAGDPQRILRIMEFSVFDDV